MHDVFKMDESVCVAKFEQQCVVTVIKIIENEPKSRWLIKNILLLHVSFILNSIKSTSYYDPLTALFQ